MRTAHLPGSPLRAPFRPRQPLHKPALRIPPLLSLVEKVPDIIVLHRGREESPRTERVQLAAPSPAGGDSVVGGDVLAVVLRFLVVLVFRLRGHGWGVVRVAREAGEERRFGVRGRCREDMRVVAVFADGEVRD